MRRLQRQRIGNVGARLLDRLFRQSEHQIQIEIVQPDVVRGFGGGDGVAAVVNPAQPPQLVVSETLYADRQAIYAGGPEFGEPTPLHGSRIRLQGDFQIRTQRQAGAQPRQQPLQRFRRQ